MAGTTVTVTLGKDVTITGVTNARSCTVTNSASDVDVTKFGDTSRKFRKALIEQTVELECVDDPGVTVGSTFTIAGTQTGNAVYVCTNVAESQPLDGIITYTVSGSRTFQS
jgi:Tfp pilus assembly protein PilW